MDKSSKKSFKVDAAPSVVPLSKAVKRGKREVENESEKSVNAKKQRKDEAVQKKAEVKTQKKKVDTSSCEELDSSDSKDDQKHVSKVSSVANKPTVVAMSVKKESSDSSSDEDSSEDMRDRISELPEDIRAMILSRLPLREAISTSLISHEWKFSLHLAAPRMKSLDFDAYERMKKLRRLDHKEDELKVEADKFVNEVNRWLELHNSATQLEELRIQFWLSEKHDVDIVKWSKTRI